jgi:uncharacterized protein (UPF0303 family)
MLVQDLLEQEQRLQFPALSHDEALSLGGALVDRARAEGLPLTLDIRFGEQQLFHVALAGTCADNDAWIERKARVVRRFGHSTRYMTATCAALGVTFAEEYLLDPETYAAAGGSFPLLVRGVGMVGTVTVSGLTDDEDHDFLVAGLSAFIDKQQADS